MDFNFQISTSSIKENFNVIFIFLKYNRIKEIYKFKKYIYILTNKRKYNLLIFFKTYNMEKFIKKEETKLMKKYIIFFKSTAKATNSYYYYLPWRQTACISTHTLLGQPNTLLLLNIYKR